MGEFVGSHPSCCDLGEYSAFHLALYETRARVERVPSPFKNDFIERMFSATLSFAERERVKSGARFWCDQTPLNVLVGGELATRWRMR